MILRRKEIPKLITFTGRGRAMTREAWLGYRSEFFFFFFLSFQLWPTDKVPLSFSLKGNKLNQHNHTAYVIALMVHLAYRFSFPCGCVIAVLLVVYWAQLDFSNGGYWHKTWRKGTRHCRLIHFMITSNSVRTNSNNKLILCGLGSVLFYFVLYSVLFDSLECLAWLDDWHCKRKKTERTEKEVSGCYGGAEMHVLLLWVP